MIARGCCNDPSHAHHSPNITPYARDVGLNATTTDEDIHHINFCTGDTGEKHRSAGGEGKGPEKLVGLSEGGGVGGVACEGMR